MAVEIDRDFSGVVDYRSTIIQSATRFSGRFHSPETLPERIKHLSHYSANYISRLTSMGPFNVVGHRTPRDHHVPRNGHT